jgi:hypothetical protein
MAPVAHNGALRDLTPNDPHDVPPFSLEGGGGFAISPDSKELAFTENPDPEPATQRQRADLYARPDQPGREAGRGEHFGGRQLQPRLLARRQVPGLALRSARPHLNDALLAQLDLAQDGILLVHRRRQNKAPGLPHPSAGASTPPRSTRQVPHSRRAAGRLGRCVELSLERRAVCRQRLRRGHDQSARDRPATGRPSSTA